MRGGSLHMVAFGHRAALTALAAADGAASSGQGDTGGGGGGATETTVASAAADGVARLWRLTTDSSCGSTASPLLDCRWVHMHLFILGCHPILN